MLDLYTTVKLKKKHPELHLKEGSLGAVVDVLKNGEAYTVEFLDENGNTNEEALYTYFKENELEVVKNNT